MTGKPDYSFQIPLVKAVFKDLKTYQRNLLAAAAGAGKTNMVIDLLSQYYLPEYSDYKVLILSHGQVVLRDQWIERFERVGVDFSFQELVSGSTIDLSKQVYVGIPQYFNKKALDILKGQKILLIVDEAHQYYFAEDGMVQNIIETLEPESTLCVTGTPSEFIKRKDFRIHFISPSEVAERGAYSYVSMELCHSPYSFTEKEYLKNGELKLGIDIKKAQTHATLNNMLKQLDQETLLKTMVICSSQKQAKDVEDFFTDKGYMSALSTSDTDADSGAIKFFKENDDCNVLIVVNRGILGFDCPEIINLLDLKCSYNPDIIMQYLARIFRLHPTGRVRKRYLRAMNQDRIIDEWHIMNFMVSLMSPENFESFDGEVIDKTIRMEFPLIQNKWSSSIDEFFLNFFRAVQEQQTLPSLELFNGGNNNNYGDVTLRNLMDFEKTIVNNYRKRMV